ncbi:putative transferase, protein kinase RLK-Pelle-WAK family [Rosa chinensis]|uniref:Putative transferase, protein kinase RLK-Pelle-WAK family n=1 Tax=Rosa chinensis TaxID=74649 RepID=A0A2P6SCK2_ROSCH|nr:putative transferase, protein kinase RLK-Pelle-WAK family [Rosa chinensis]
MGYLDPEYLQSNTLTEKSDVYSFGFVLVELLTSRMALSLDRPEAERSLANVFVCAVDNTSLPNHGQHFLTNTCVSHSRSNTCGRWSIDEEVVNDGNFETVEKVADLAKRCISMKGRERPTMREVTRELERLQILPKHSGGEKPDSSPKETDYLLASPSNAYVVDVKGEGDVVPLLPVLSMTRASKIKPKC